MKTIKKILLGFILVVTFLVMSSCGSKDGKNFEEFFQKYNKTNNVTLNYKMEVGGTTVEIQLKHDNDVISASNCFGEGDKYIIKNSDSEECTIWRYDNEKEKFTSSAYSPFPDDLLSNFSGILGFGSIDIKDELFDVKNFEYKKGKYYLRQELLESVDADELTCDFGFIKNSCVIKAISNSGKPDEVKVEIKISKIGGTKIKLPNEIRK